TVTFVTVSSDSDSFASLVFTSRRAHFDYSFPGLVCEWRSARCTYRSSACRDLRLDRHGRFPHRLRTKAPGRKVMRFGAAAVPGRSTRTQGGAIVSIVVALGVLAGVLFGAGIGRAHDRVGAVAPAIDGARDAGTDVLTRRMLDGRLTMTERLRIAKLRRDRL